jgi:UDP-glucose 4-epimerase
MNVLLTGGAGYIGSHVVRSLQRAGCTCCVYDNLSRGHAAAVEGRSEIVVADLADGQTLRRTLRDRRIDAVIHLAAFIEAGESVRQPGRYFRNNTANGLELLEAMRETGVGTMVFSSTAAVYGTPRRVPIRERARTEPINPYGASKLCVEYMMRAHAAAHGMSFAALRYFNVAGADPAGDIGEDHDPETHLIPLVLQAAMGRREGIKVFGRDYPTEDGTCVRDYIHVCDLADAHVLALRAVRPGRCEVFNLGNGEGFSVREVIETCRSVTAAAIPAEDAPRRAGDPARLVASAEKARKKLNWRPKYPRLEEIVRHAWAWHTSHPQGYGA